MKTKIIVSLCSLLAALSAGAQSTMFTYQGSLSDGGKPANGTNYGMVFYLYDAPTGGNVLGNEGIVSVTVSNGLFAVLLDFSNQFDGSARWLEISVQKNGGGFTTLAPRQEITSAPYAIQALNAASATTAISATTALSAATATSAGSVAASNISGTISLAQLPPAVVTNGAGAVNLSGSFSGNGAGVTNVNFEANSGGAIHLAWGNFVVGSTSGVGQRPNYVTAADINGDGKVDAITANFGDSTVTVLTNDGTGRLVSNASYTVGYKPYCVAAVDSRGTGKMDLVTADEFGNSFTVLTNDSSGGFRFAYSNALGFGPVYITTADVNKDGRMDLVLVGYVGLVVFTNDGSGNFVGASTNIVGPSPQWAVAADFNGDGYVDLASANNEGQSVTVLTNDGHGNFAGAGTYPTDLGPYALAAADFNGDGAMDLVCANESGGSLSVLTNDGHGGFATATKIKVGGTLVSVAAQDLNADGSPDLICADVAGGALTILTNDGRGHFAFAATNFAAKSPVSLAEADLTGSGKTDLVCATDNPDLVLALTNAATVIGSFAGSFADGTFSGSFSGSGTALTGLNTTNLSGTISQTNLGGGGSYIPLIGDGANNFLETTADGHYTRVGNLVFVEILLGWDNKASANNAANLVVSLPFAVGASPTAVFNLGFVYGVSFNGQLAADALSGSTNIVFYDLSHNGGDGPTPITIADCPGAGQLQISGFFRMQ